MIEIKNKKIYKDGKPFRSITGDLNGCNTEIRFASGISGAQHPWTTFGQKKLNPGFEGKFMGTLKSLKGKALLAGVFSGKLLTRASRGRDARGATVWSPGHGAPGSNNDAVQANFFKNPEAIAMQRQLIDFIIAAIEKKKVPAVLVFLWESQVVKGNRNFLPWLYGHMEYVRKKAPWLPVGIHNHEKETVLKVEKKIKSIFWFQEGDAWKEAHLDKLSEIAPGIVGHLNPGKFRPNKPWLLFKEGWEKLVQDGQESIRSGLIKIGTAGTLYKRWVNEGEAKGDIDEKYQNVLENFDFKQVSSLMSDFLPKISRELEKYKTNETLPPDFGKGLLWKPQPAADEKKKPAPEQEAAPEPQQVKDPVPAKYEPPPQEISDKREEKMRLKIKFGGKFPFIHIDFKSFFRRLWGKYGKNWKTWLFLIWIIYTIIVSIIAF